MLVISYCCKSLIIKENWRNYSLRTSRDKHLFLVQVVAWQWSWIIRSSNTTRTYHSVSFLKISYVRYDKYQSSLIIHERKHNRDHAKIPRENPHASRISRWPEIANLIATNNDATFNARLERKVRELERWNRACAIHNDELWYVLLCDVPNEYYREYWWFSRRLSIACHRRFRISDFDCISNTREGKKIPHIDGSRTYSAINLTLKDWNAIPCIIILLLTSRIKDRL